MWVAVGAKLTIATDTHLLKHNYSIAESSTAIYWVLYTQTVYVLYSALVSNHVI
jgi:hypothetical protein